ncbi:MAG: hypothetical protein QOJ02_4263 [Acidobacteriota bacterium]|jgi:hypothetical protein|nr:hypothetical protein [Acidobacteriota bacterium]
MCSLSLEESVNYLKSKLKDAKVAECIKNLRLAYQDRNLTLYLGAGVSLGNGLPSWENLVLSMYFSGLQEQAGDETEPPYPNYLFAIAEWHLEKRREPLDITARKIHNLYNKRDFLRKLKHTLYAGFQRQTPDRNSLLQANQTLNSIVRICAPQPPARAGVRSVISYNYDNLLELALNGGAKAQPVWRDNQKIKSRAMPIYHVHGYVPIEGSGSRAEEIVFTEEQYHLVAQNAYSWSNLVQIQSMSTSVGLMVGLSLTDRNMRRLLDAIRKIPVQSKNYILLQEPSWPEPEKSEMKEINKRAREYFRKFQDSGIKTEERRYQQIGTIIKQIEGRYLEEQASILEDMGVHAIWYKDHSEISVIIDRIIQPL